MNQKRECPECGAAMEEGFLLDRSYGGAAWQAVWHRGFPEERTVFGLKTDTLKMSKSQMLRIITYRCPDCGLIRSYAKT
ncbi:MAG: PF20097 family protein [Planctomycetaceae bacterium]